MKNQFFTKLIVAAAVVSISTQVKAANILLNSSFESEVQNGLGNHFPVTVTDWTQNVPATQFNLVVTDGSTVANGIDSSHSGTQYLDLVGVNGWAQQSVTLAMASSVSFGSYFSRRDGTNSGGRVDIYDSTNTALIFSSPTVIATSEEEWILSESTQTFVAGTYIFRVDLDDFSNADSAFFDVQAVPEPSALGLLGLGGVAALGLRRRRA